MNKTAFVAFYTVYPSNMGSSEVSSSFFETWSGEKRIFQISHLKKINNKKIYTCFIKKETPFYKISKIFELTIQVKKYFYNSKNSNIIIEGPSWIGYSFIFFILSKIFLSKTFFIYHSHSIEYEIRKNNSNFLISWLTRIMENYIFNNVNIATSVSLKERIKIKKLYNKKTVLLPNGIFLNKLKSKKKIVSFPKRYIFYSGSYLYKPNKHAIDLLNQFFMPRLIKKFPDLKLVLTGGGYQQNYKWLVNLNIVNKNYLIQLLKKSQLILVPIYEGYGTRVKIIEALMLGVPVISTPTGIDGIKYKQKGFNTPLVNMDKRKLLKYAEKVLKNIKYYKVNSNLMKKKFIFLYSMENITKKFQQELIKNDN
jgi:glycosyltransferase involved in cell wall biosynthesis